MMPSSGPPTPKGVGGPTPPLVSRGSEEEWKMKIPTVGPHTSVGGGDPTSLPTPGGREVSAPTVTPVFPQQIRRTKYTWNVNTHVRYSDLL